MDRDQQKMNCFEVSVLLETPPSGLKERQEKDLWASELYGEKEGIRSFLCEEKDHQRERPRAQRVEPTGMLVIGLSHNQEIGNFYQAGFQNLWDNNCCAPSIFL